MQLRVSCAREEAAAPPRTPVSDFDGRRPLSAFVLGLGGHFEGAAYGGAVETGIDNFVHRAIFFYI
jgi:hypothetical protein